MKTTAQQVDESRPRLLIAEPLDFSPQALAILQSAADVTCQTTDRADLAEALAAYDVIWLRLAHQIDRALLNGAVRTRILATPVTGLDHIDLEACAERGVRVISLRGEVEFLKQIRATAELTLGLSLALMRNIARATDDVRDGHWRRDRFRGHELHEKKVGLVGVGRLGSIVAGYFQALGAEVGGFDPRSDFPVHVARRFESLEELLIWADVVSLHVSYDASTRHLIGARELAAMKPSAVLINTSRGGVIDELALAEALENGSLAGAALDVLDGEPHIASDHPLIQLARRTDRLLLTPHIGGNTYESFEKTECFLAHRVVEALTGLTPAKVAT